MGKSTKIYFGKSVSYILTKVMDDKEVDLYKVSGRYLVVCHDSYEFLDNFYDAQYRTECI